MKHISRFVGVVAGAVLVVGVASGFAQESKWVRGTVSSLSGNTITVKAAGQDMAFTVDNETHVIGRGAGTAARVAQGKGQEGPRLADVVKLGDAVEVHYIMKGAANYATMIRRDVPLGAAAEKEKSAAPVEQSGTSMTGVITAVTGQGLTLSVSGREQAFAADAKTTVVAPGAGTMTRELTQRGQKPTLADYLGKGDLVTVAYRQVGSKLFAGEIHILRKLK